MRSLATGNKYPHCPEDNMGNSNGSVRCDIDNHVGTIIIEKTGRRNALDYDMAGEITEIFERMKTRDDMVIPVIRGAGNKAFSAGFDLKIDRDEQTEEQKQLWPEMISSIEDYEYPVLAMVNGDVYGGAMEVIAACDLRVGVSEARFAITPAKIGLVYGGHAINRIMEVIGPAKTRELLFTANAIDAGHAKEIGLLNHCVDRDRLKKQTYDMAADIGKNAPFSLKKMKEIVDTTVEKTRLSGTEEKWVQQVRERAMDSDDYAEGVEAFSEGRDPDFQGV